VKRANKVVTAIFIAGLASTACRPFLPRIDNSNSSNQDNEANPTLVEGYSEGEIAYQEISERQLADGRYSYVEAHADTPEDLQIAEGLEQLRASTVYISAIFENDERAGGTGFAAWSGPKFMYIATAAHTLIGDQTKEAPNRIKVSRPDQPGSEVLDLTTDEIVMTIDRSENGGAGSNDVAVIAIPHNKAVKLGLTVMPITETYDPTIGSVVITTGFTTSTVKRTITGGEAFVGIQFGRIGMVENPFGFDNIANISFENEFFAGNSGSPISIYDPNTGQEVAIGIVMGTNGDGNYIIPLGSVVEQISMIQARNP